MPARQTKKPVPQSVLAKARELTRRNVAKVDAPVETTTTRSRVDNGVRAKVIATLKRLHPMD
jgi:hypothetical protein